MLQLTPISWEIKMKIYFCFHKFDIWYYFGYIQNRLLSTDSTILVVLVGRRLCYGWNGLGEILLCLFHLSFNCWLSFCISRQFHPRTPQTTCSVCLCRQQTFTYSFTWLSHDRLFFEAKAFFKGSSQSSEKANVKPKINYRKAKKNSSPTICLSIFT